MRALLMTAVGVVPQIATVPDPEPAPGGVVVKVEATGLCRSDWHGWVGNEVVDLPHVPGHEWAGTVAAVGEGVTSWRVGDRVTAPFVCACGDCPECRRGHHQVCRNQRQPGFDYWGSFAEYVAIPFAETNLVRLPADLSFVAAASLGCRFATSYRAIRQVADVQAGERVVVFGCGGVGLAAVMIAAAAGAEVTAVDVSRDALDLARAHGAHATEVMHAGIGTELHARHGGGVDVTVDALGAAALVQEGLVALRPLGRHVQVGLLPQPIELRLSAVHARELQICGSHGMAAHDYPQMLAEIASGALTPGQLVTRTIPLDAAGDALVALSDTSPTGVTVVTP